MHRSKIPYSGVSPDLNIEQTLMASVKGNQGITRGRGWTELNQLIWLSSRPTVHVCKLDQQLRKMAGIDLRSGQGSVKALRAARLGRDNKDLATWTTYFSSRFLFDRNVASTSLKNISTGLVSPSNVSVQKACDV